MKKKPGMQLKDAALKIGQHLMTGYWGKIWKILNEKPELKKKFPAFISNPEKLVFYFGENHLALEYIGPHYKDQLESSYKSDLQFFDYTESKYLMDEILGFQYDGTSNMRTRLSGVLEDLFVPSLKAFDVLEKNGWNFAAQSMIFGINLSGFELPQNEFIRLINCFFYGADDNGLIVRHIKWLDIFPLEITDVGEEIEEFKVSFWPDTEERVLADSHYCFPMPTDFQEEKLTILNRFVELFSSSGVKEPHITKFLSEQKNQFILKMVFFAKEVHPEKKCVWASENREPIKPDFFVTLPNGYADIVEFKLPSVQSLPIVGKENRETFSAEIYSYVAQTRTYSEYFDDPRNTKFAKDKYGINVLYPRRWLVIGRRWMFSTHEWKSIENEFKDFAIRTYDDIVDGVRSQLYS